MALQNKSIPLFLILITSTWAWIGTKNTNHHDNSNTWNRRKFILTFSPGLSLPFFSSPSLAVPDTRSRSVDVGGGVDVSIDTSNKILSDPSNLVFPAALQGRYNCQRAVVSVEGDVYQAQSAWKSLGGGGTNQKQFKDKSEEFETHLIPYENNYAVLDRAYEWSTRNQLAINNIEWNPSQPNLLRTTKDDTEIAVVQRSVIMPNPEQGILAGGQELIRITQGPFARAALIKQRFRQGATPGVIEGLEIIKTFRVLDGIAGTEFPTSTTKSQIRLTRIGPLDEKDLQLASSVTTSSLYFDGSNWY